MWWRNICRCLQANAIVLQQDNRIRTRIYKPMQKWLRLGGLCVVIWGLLIPLWAQVGVRSYVVRRLFEPGMKQKFNVVYSLRGDIRSSTFEQSLPIALDAQLEIRTEVLKVFDNGQARIRYSFRYVKQEVNLFADKDLPPPFTETVRITPGGFPAEDETTAKFRRAQKKNQQETEKETSEEPSFPGLDFVPDASTFLLWIGLDVVPGPFYPLPIGAVREGDEWQIRYPTPFLDTRGGKLSLEQATVYTYPAIVKVIGVKEVRGRPTLHVQQVTKADIDFRLDDTLIELVRLGDRNIPRGRLTGTIQGTIDYYLALSDGALVQASGSERLKLRAEYDAQTIREWQPDEPWAEWEVQATFRQVLADERQSPPLPKPTTSPRRR